MTQEFKNGDRVRTHNGVGTVAAPAAPGIVRYDDGGWDSLSNPQIIASITHLPDAPEPEDTDEIDSLGGLPAGDDTPVVRAFVASRVKRDMAEDADDVEPEPLKEGDACLVWARFGRVDKLDVAHVELPMPDGRVHDGYVRPDAIVRPSAGQVPPWVNPVEEPTELGTVVFCEEGALFVRVHAYGKRPWGRSGFDEHRSWDEIPAVERVVKGGAS